MPNIEEHVDQVVQIVTSEKPGKVWFSSADLDYAFGQLDLTEKTAKQCNFSIVGVKQQAPTNSGPDFTA